MGESIKGWAKVGEGAVKIYGSPYICTAWMTLFVVFYQQLSLKWKKSNY